MLDILGHPVRAGDKVLTGAYYSFGQDLVTNVVRTTPKAVYVNVDVYNYDSSTHTRKSHQHVVRRRYDQVVVVDKQLAHNKKKYPEYLI